MATDAEIMSSQPRGGGFFGQMFANRGIDIGARKRAQQQQIVTKTLNEEIEAQIGDASSVNLTEALPQAYFAAARRIAALGNSEESQKLFAAGIEALQSTSKHAAELNQLRAQANQLDEAPNEFLETVRKRDALAAQLPKFGEDTPTGASLRSRIAELNNRIDVLNESDAAGAKLPDNLVEWQQYNRSRIERNEAPVPYDVFHNEERMTSTRAQDYRAYVETERAAGRKPVAYENWTPTFQGQVTASNTLGETGIKRLDEEEATAQQSVASIGSIKNSLDLLNAGVRSGTAAGLRQSVARATATFLGDDPSAETVNTDAYIASAAPRVVEIVRALAPVTDQDKAYIQQAVAGDLSTATPEALRKMLEIAYRAQTAKITRFNERLNRLGDAYQDVAGVFDPISVPTIDFAAPAARPGEDASIDDLVKFYAR